MDSFWSKRVKNKSSDFEAAKAYAFLLLKFRLRSAQELRERLKKKKFDGAVTEKTVTFLQEKKFLDDALFTKAWVQLRLRRQQGLRKIKEELRIKGIDKEIVARQLEQVKENYREEEIAAKLAEERLKALQGIEPRSARRRVYAYLARRGFSPGIIADVMNNLCNQTS